MGVLDVVRLGRDLSVDIQWEYFRNCRPCHAHIERCQNIKQTQFGYPNSTETQQHMKGQNSDITERYLAQLPPKETQAVAHGSRVHIWTPMSKLYLFNLLCTIWRRHGQIAWEMNFEPIMFTNLTNGDPLHRINNQHSWN